MMNRIDQARGGHEPFASFKVRKFCHPEFLRSDQNCTLERCLSLYWRLVWKAPTRSAELDAGSGGRRYKPIMFGLRCFANGQISSCAALPSRP